MEYINKITMPKFFSPDDAAIISESVKQSAKYIDDKIKNMNWLLGAIVLVLFIGFLTMLFMVGGIVIETWRFKSNSYEAMIETMRAQDQIIQNNNQKQNESKTLLENIQKVLENKGTFYKQTGK